MDQPPQLCTLRASLAPQIVALGCSEELGWVKASTALECDDRGTGTFFERCRCRPRWLGPQAPNSLAIATDSADSQAKYSRWIRFGHEAPNPMSNQSGPFQLVLQPRTLGICCTPVEVAAALRDLLTTPTRAPKCHPKGFHWEIVESKMFPDYDDRDRRS